MPHGVGIVGAGPGVAALHLPTLARLSDDFEVVHVADGGSGRAADLAARVGARSSSGIAELLADPARRGRRAVQPAGRARRPDPRERRGRQARDPVREAARDDRGGCRGGDRRVPRAPARRCWSAPTTSTTRPGAARSITCSPAGTRCARSRSPSRSRRTAATTTSSPSCRRPPPRPGAAAPTSSVPQVAASVVRQLITGLAVHDLPMLRDLAPDDRARSCSRARSPRSATRSGYRASGIPVRLTTVMLPGRRRRAVAPRHHDRHRPASRCRSRRPSCTPAARRCACGPPTGKRTTYPIDADDGYLAEWRALADVLDGVERGRVRRAARRRPLRDHAGGCRGRADRRGAGDDRRRSVVAGGPLPRRALAELPLSTRRVDRAARRDRRGRRATTDGWMPRCAAASAGARRVVVADPGIRAGRTTCADSPAARHPGHHRASAAAAGRRGGCRRRTDGASGGAPPRVLVADGGAASRPR